jgi:N-acetyl-anhydromuramyl-L-alanine amidase AmpD
MLVDPKILPKRFTTLEHGGLAAVHAIVVHQTDTATEQAVFNDYHSKRGIGAHFLIAKSGMIFQTASVKKRCFHVGVLRAKCLEINPAMCTGSAYVGIQVMSWTAQLALIAKMERQKSYPHRYPMNIDSIGVELVGKSLGPRAYEAVTLGQNASLRWLVTELSTLFRLGKGEVNRHPEISHKSPGEAGTAKW